MIVGKYFKSNSDFINVMKSCKRYHDLAQMYHFNPISDISLFNKMETQYLYDKKDIKKERMRQYIYWYTVDGYELKHKRENEILKKVEINKEKGWGEDELAYPLPVKNGECVVPEGVTSIGIGCFSGRSSLTSIQLPSTLLNIGGFAFGHTNITTITIPKGITAVKMSCFSGCSSLTSVQLPSSLITIEEYAFVKTNIKSIIIPEGVTSIKDRCFSECELLSSVKYW